MNIHINKHEYNEMVRQYAFSIWQQLQAGRADRDRQAAIRQLHRELGAAPTLQQVSERAYFIYLDRKDRDADADWKTAVTLVHARGFRCQE